MAYLLIYAALGVLHLSICKLDVVSVFFNLRVVRKTPAELSPLDLLCMLLWAQKGMHKILCIISRHVVLGEVVDFRGTLKGAAG